MKTNYSSEKELLLDIVKNNKKKQLEEKWNYFYPKIIVIKESKSFCI